MRNSRTGNYRSRFELNIAEFFTKRGINFEYEPCKLDYIVPETKHKYTPDWEIGGDATIYYESKGRLTARDRQKMLQVRASNPDINIRLIFQNPNVRLTKTSKTTYADWADKNGFEWTTLERFPKKWLRT